MKKVLFLILLVGCVAMANAQSAVGVTHQNQTFNDGDTISVTIASNAESYAGIGLKNQSNSRLEGLVITLAPVTVGGIEIYASCTGEVCIPGLVSNPIDINIRGSYNNYMVDFSNNYPEVTTPSVYTMTVANDDVSTTVVLKFQLEGVGIDQHEAFGIVNALSNPFNNVVTIGYATLRPATLVVYDIFGRTRLYERVDGTGTLYLRDHLTPGVYVYGLLVDKSCRVMKKLVVK